MPKLTTDFDRGTGYALTGSLLNPRAAKLNQYSASRVLDAAAMRDGCGKPVVHANVKISVMTITSAEDDCSVDELGQIQAPCAERYLYLGSVKTWDQTVQRWTSYEEDQTLDASVRQQKFTKDDQIPVTYNQLRGAWIPLNDTRVLLFPRYSALLQTVTGIEVIQAENASREDRDSFVELYFQINRPEDDGWQTIGRLSWFVPWLDTQRAWENTRSSVAVFEAPHGTKFRWASAGAWTPAEGDPFDKFDFNELEWTAFGISSSCYRVGESGDAERIYDHDSGKFDPSLTPVNELSPFLKVMEVKPERANAPEWSIKGAVATVSYEDPDACWLIGVGFTATLRSQRTVAERRGGIAYPWHTSITCSEDQRIGEICKRDFGFQGGVGARIDFGTSEETCIDCQDVCGVCTWEWTEDPTTEDQPPVLDFWNNAEPCKDTGPSDCTCPEPPRAGLFYGEIFITLCSEPSSSSASTLTSTSISSMTSESSRSSGSSISASSSTQSITTSSATSESTLGGG